jgi:hypothetical protein
MANSGLLPRTQASDPAARERRVWVRYLCDLPTSCHPLLTKDSECWSGRVQNISRGGLNLVVSRRFEPGTLLQIELQGPQDSEPRTVLARVVHARPGDADHWALGCAFAFELGEDMLHALLDISDATMS